MENIDEVIEKMATKGADYLRKRYATLYIQQMEYEGKWPSHLTNVNYALKNDLGKALKLKGTAYFNKFHKSCHDKLAGMLKSSDNVLKLYSIKGVGEECKNFAKLMNGFSELDWINYRAAYNEDTIKMEFDKNKKTVKVHESECVYYDPFDGCGEEYRNKDTYL